MATRKSFIIHIDSLDVLDDLNNEEAGKLFKAIKSYHLNDDFEFDAITKIAFSQFKNQFKRDDEKYIKLCEKNKLIAENRYKSKPTTGRGGNQTKPTVTKSTDNKSDSDSDSDSKDIKDIVAASPQRKFSDGDMAFVDGMLNLLMQTNPKFKQPNKEVWADKVRLMRERDKLTHEEMATVFTWANNDHFWSSNILSPSKLRDKWDTLFAQSTKAPKPPVSQNEDWNDDNWHENLGM